jgi:hypothetical protein
MRAFPSTFSAAFNFPLLFSTLLMGQKYKNRADRISLKNNAEE